MEPLGEGSSHRYRNDPRAPAERVRFSGSVGPLFRQDGDLVAGIEKCPHQVAGPERAHHLLGGVRRAEKQNLHAAGAWK